MGMDEIIWQKGGKWEEKSVLNKETSKIQGAREGGTPKRDGEGANERRKQERWSQTKEMFQEREIIKRVSKMRVES